MPLAVYILFCFGLLLSCNRALLFAQDQTSTESFREVKQIFQTHCYSCHGVEKQRNDLRLDRPSSILKGGSSGPVIIPGNSGESLLVHLISGKDPERRMPAKGSPLSSHEIEVIRRWIDSGAQLPDDPSEAEEVPWSLKPIKKVAVPEVNPEFITQNPIDHFILTALQKKGLAPSAPADRRALIRRLSFNLHGLPPAPEEVAAYLQDHSPTATATLVDRLLDSPRYGERWARHWLDLVHYAETHGHDQDRPRTNAWPYRDYVIDSFNKDKPYTQFVQEQVAGDVLWPEDPQATVALGFLATGPWDESSLRDIREDTLDRQIARYLDRDDIVMTVMNTFVSSTAQCARCHNHKFDPVSQVDYYNLQAIFAATDKGNKLYDPDPSVAAKRKALLQRKAELEKPSSSSVDNWLLGEFQENVSRWAIQEKTNAIVWQVLQPSAVISTNHSELQINSDDSINAGGQRPDRDTYFITAPIDEGATALRLEVLRDEKLPMQGPGRQDNGNLHLTHFQVLFTPEGASNSIEISLQNPTADWNQEGWDITRAIDADPKTAWGIYPKVGQSHQAAFEFKEKISKGKLTAILHQNHGGGHLIGKLRLSITTNPLPIRINSLPDHLSKILAKPEQIWNREERLLLARHVANTEIERELKILPEQKLVFVGTSDFVQDASFKPAGKPREVRVLKRGDIKQPGAEAIPAAPGFIKELSGNFGLDAAADEGLRRAKLAQWLTDPRNALAWRSIVNRVWQYHFGAGLVTTASDFGRMGSEPSHPELLDWLANWFIENGGSFKKLHKLILTSATYQQSSQHHPAYAAVDGDNRLLWRMNRTRLDAETVKDTMVYLTGRLDSTMGGPSAQHFLMTPGIHVTPNVDYASFAPDDPANYRRAIYRFVFRTLPDPFMDALDCPDSSQLTPTRNSSVTVAQALAMLNDKSVVRLSELFAQRVEEICPEDTEIQVKTIWNMALGREASETEVEALVHYTKAHGLPNFCRLVFNSNEFFFVN